MSRGSRCAGEGPAPAALVQPSRASAQIEWMSRSSQAHSTASVPRADSARSTASSAASSLANRAPRTAARTAIAPMCHASGASRSSAAARPHTRSVSPAPPTARSKLTQPEPRANPLPPSCGAPSLPSAATRRATRPWADVRATSPCHAAESAWIRAACMSNSSSRAPSQAADGGRRDTGACDASNVSFGVGWRDAVGSGREGGQIADRPVAWCSSGAAGEKDAGRGGGAGSRGARIAHPAAEASRCGYEMSRSAAAAQRRQTAGSLARRRVRPSNDVVREEKSGALGAARGAARALLVSCTRQTAWRVPAWRERATTS
eukprot:scaffold12640_cov106-Isochrysis_galbana.AAC.8